MTTRRQFVIRAPFALLGAAAACREREPQGAAGGTAQDLSTPGAPPTFGTMTQAGPEVSPSTFAEAEKLAQVELTNREREQMAASWRRSMAALLERRTGPRKLELAPEAAPGFVWNPALPGVGVPEVRDRFVRSQVDPGPLPTSDDDVAYAPVTSLSRWIETRKLSAERLTRIYLDRIDRLDGKLRSVITLLREPALAQAKELDAEIAAGIYRGPLHGIPWGAKDLVDTAGVATTYGAEPFRNRVPETDAAVVARLREAGAILIAKLSLGALALNDIWFGGQTMNPWLLEEGASGSSAGPGAATAAALVGFSLGSETGGSIISPAMRCGVTGLRPTFGRVPRSGAMTLCWSLDKLGPITRTVEDSMLVLSAISGPDAGGRRERRRRARVRRRRPNRRVEGGVFSEMDGGVSFDRCGPRGARRGRPAGHGARPGPAPRLALRLAHADSLRRGGGLVREADAYRRRRYDDRADAGCVAQPLPGVALPLGS